jgi:hypothetical protein
VDVRFVRGAGHYDHAVQLDLATALPLVVSVLGVLGVGTIIGQWFAGGKDRRAARAAVLAELGEVEAARWARGDDESAERTAFQTAIRQLQTAALIARLPRRPVVLYSQLALVSLWYTRSQLDLYDDPEASGLPGDFALIVREAAEMISKAAWASPATRWIWLPRRQRQVAGRAQAIEHPELARFIADAPRFVR